MNQKKEDENEILLEDFLEDVERKSKEFYERKKKYPFVFLFVIICMFFLAAEDLMLAGYDEEMDQFNQMFKGDSRFLGDGNFSECVIINNITSICDWEIWMYNQTTATLGLTSAEGNLTYINRSGDVVSGEWTFNGNITISNNVTINGYVCNATNCYNLENFLTDTTGSADMVYTNISMLNESINIFTGIGDRYLELYETSGGTKVELVVRANHGYVGTVNNFPFSIITNNQTAIYIDTGQDVGVDMVPIHGKLDVGGSIWAEDWANATNVTAREYICNESNCYALESFLGAGSGDLTSQIANDTYINRSGDYTTGGWTFNGNITITNNLTVYDYFCNKSVCYVMEDFLPSNRTVFTSAMGNNTYALKIWLRDYVNFTQFNVSLQGNISMNVISLYTAFGSADTGNFSLLTTNYGSAVLGNVSGMTPGDYVNFSQMGDAIDGNLSIKYYNATTNTTVEGTPSGNIEYLQVYDGIPYNVTETAGAPGLDFRINFTGVTDFDQLVIRYSATPGESHVLYVQIYDYTDSGWENYATFVDVGDYNIKTLGVYDPTDHILGGVVQVRFYISDNGNINHHHYFDWVTLVEGVGVPSGTEIDPYAVHRDGNTTLSADWDVGSYGISAKQLNASDWSNLTTYLTNNQYLNQSFNESTVRAFVNESWTESLARTIFNTTWVESLARTIFPTFAWVDSAISGNRTDLANADLSNFTQLMTNLGSSVLGNKTDDLTNVAFLNNSQTFTGNITIEGNLTLEDYLCNESTCYNIENFLGGGGGDLTSAMGNLTYINRNGDVVSGDLNITNDLIIGKQTITGLCRDGWIRVPGNASLGTVDFCVMKYEAKARDGIAQSIAHETPWVSITQTSAIEECKEIGAHLCSTQEVQTINRDIASVAGNWKDDTMGTCLYGGHVDNNPASALQANESDDYPYTGTGDSSSDTFECPFDNSVGASDGKEQRRTFTLSNGEVIWDWSGNVWEWMINTCTAGSGTGAWDGDAAWEEWSSSEFDDYERDIMGPSNGLWNANNGTGGYYGCTSGGNAFLRGGYWDAGVYAGVSALYLDSAPSSSTTSVGFRCCSS